MRIELRVNGEQREADVHGAESLLFVLRERLDLPGAKGACEEGECGSCSVLLDGQLVCACLVHGAQADGREVVTVEGLAADGRLHAVQRAFLAAGAVQCGFCTPGLVVATVALLENDPSPERGRRARGALRQPLPLYGLRPHLRGRAAGRRGVARMSTTQLVRGRIGEIVERPDGVPKVSGEFAYSSDLSVPGMLHGATLRSPHAHARILSIDIAAALALPGVHAVLTHADVPGAKTYGLEFADQPVLASDRVRYEGEPVAIVAALSLEEARQAVRAIAVEYEPLPPVDDMTRATEMPPLHPDRPTMGHGYRTTHGPTSCARS